MAGLVIHITDRAYRRPDAGLAATLAEASEVYCVPWMPFCLFKTTGLRWLSLMLLVPIPGAGRVWALPFLTALGPSERYCRERGRRHKRLTDWARQLVLQACRWLPGREVVLVGDS